MLRDEISSLKNSNKLDKVIISQQNKKIFQVESMIRELKESMIMIRELKESMIKVQYSSVNNIIELESL